MSKSLEELQREYEKNTVKLEQEKRKLRRLENRKSYLDSGSRKQRSHRLITRGAAIESVMPEVKILTEQEFYSLMERIAEWQPVQNMVRLAVENHSGPRIADAVSGQGAAPQDARYMGVRLCIEVRPLFQRDFCRFRLCSVFPLFFRSFAGTLGKILRTFDHDCPEALLAVTAASAA